MDKLKLNKDFTLNDKILARGVALYMEHKHVKSLNKEFADLIRAEGCVFIKNYKKRVFTDAEKAALMAYPVRNELLQELRGHEELCQQVKKASPKTKNTVKLRGGQMYHSLTFSNGSEIKISRSLFKKIPLKHKKIFR